MSTEQNKTIVRRFIEDVWGQGNAGLLDQIMTTDVCDHMPAPGQPRGLEGQRWALDMFRRGVPDMTITMDQMIAEGDFVIDRWTATGTHTGEMMGTPPTGKRFCMTGSDMSRIANGKIAEIWHIEDMLGMMQQLGLAPGMQEAPRSAGGTRPGGQTAATGPRKTLSPDEKRGRIREGFQEFIDRANPAAADRFLTPDFTGHYSAFQPIENREAFKQFIEMYNNAMRPNHAELEQILIEGEMAACRVTYNSRHTGSFMGMPPTNKQVTVKSLMIMRFAGDLVAEQWANNDDMGLLVQLGALPNMAEGVAMASPC